MLSLFGFTSQATAANDEFYGAQLEVSATGIDTSSSPAAGVDLNAGGRAGFGARFIFPIQGNFEGTAVVSQQDYHATMEGLSLQGGPASTTFAGTVRYRIDDDPHFKPYAGVGIHHTNFDSAQLAGGQFSIASASITGAVGEIGVRMPLNEVGKGLYVDLNASRYFGSASNVPMATTPAFGSVPITNVNIGNPTKFSIAVGFSF